MIPAGFKPLLADPTPDDLSKLAYPLLVSPKLDGIRCTMWGGVAYSRTLKPIPNKWIQQCLSTLPDGYDGELIVGPANVPGVMQATSSGVMKKEGRPDFTYHVFDWVHDDPSVGFGERLENLKLSVYNIDTNLIPLVTVVPHYPVGTAGALLDLESKFIASGYEGAMVRAISGRYKFGRSTTKEGILLKLKRFNDTEAVIVDFVEQMHNTNEAKINALGRTERSSAKDGKVPKGTLGAIVLEKDFGRGPQRFECGTGFDDAERQQIWNEKEGYRGSLAKIKYFELTPDGVPRFSVWLGIRNECDL